MGFFSDFIGGFTGGNERKAGRKKAEGFQRGIDFTKEQIERSRQETLPLMEAAFQNLQRGFDSAIEIPQQALQAQLQLLGAGTESLSPEGAGNSIKRAISSSRDALNPQDPQQLWKDAAAAPLDHTAVSDTPFNVTKPDFISPGEALNSQPASSPNKNAGDPSQEMLKNMLKGLF